jgi:hypothetical protein
MFRRLAIPAALFLFASFAPPAEAVPLYFDIGNCVQGDCAAFAQSGRGSIFAELDVVDGNNLLITLTNALNANATNDDPFLTALGFEYAGVLSGLTFDRFTVLSGNVAEPVFSVNSSIRTFFIDFGFGFSHTADGRFQAMDPNEVVQILVGTTGDVSTSQFNLGVAKLAGVGDGGAGGSVVLNGTPSPISVPEPGSWLAVMVGLGTVTIRRKWRAAAR